MNNELPKATIKGKTHGLGLSALELANCERKASAVVHFQLAEILKTGKYGFTYPWKSLIIASASFLRTGIAWEHSHAGKIFSESMT